MATFNYQVRTSSGQTSAGVLDATDAAQASATLRAGGNLLLRLERVSAARRSRTVVPGLSRLPFVRPRVASLEIALRQLAVMLGSGLTLLESLRSTSEQSSRLMRATLDDLAERVQEGRTLTEALDRHPWTGRMVRQLVEVGEQTGSLDIVLVRAADALEKRRLLIGQAIAALLYPFIVFLAASGVTVFMLGFAVPRLTRYLATLGRPLPAMTQILVDASNILIGSWLLIAGGILLMIVCFAVVYSSPPGRLLIDGFLLRIPVIGYIMRTSSTAMFSRSFSLARSSEN
ncbi:MAG: type II secretion system F family protein, partial [Planctomycetota bacterium]